MLSTIIIMLPRFRNNQSIVGCFSRQGIEYEVKELALKMDANGISIRAIARTLNIPRVTVLT